MSIDNRTAWQTKLLWTAVAVLGAVSFGIVALNRGEAVNATLAALFVLVVAATVIYGLINIRKALGNPQATATEIGLAAVVAGGRHA